jgi:S1-C subfamily serine protease
MSASDHTPSRPIHPTAIISFITALAGIPIVGIVTGAVAMALAGTALGQMGTDRAYRGRAYAYAGLIIGLLDVALWAALLGIAFPRGDTGAGRFDNIASSSPPRIDFAAPHVRNALEANVFLTIDKKGTVASFAEHFTGSGIIVAAKDGDFLILTNRHVVDPWFPESSSAWRPESVVIRGHFYDGTSKPMQVHWFGPDDTDLAALTTNPQGTGLTPEPIPSKMPLIGDRVFAVGNPHDLTWSYTEGVISGIRETKGPLKLKLLQTQTPINQGNSGGGLYSLEGALLGIVTWTKEKTQAEGISFALLYEDFVKMFEPESFP